MSPPLLSIIRAGAGLVSCAHCLRSARLFPGFLCFCLVFLSVFFVFAFVFFRVFDGLGGGRLVLNVPIFCGFWFKCPPVLV